ncbi:MAG: TetR/AcrR family transcriptional regulator [Saprospiraceae bacterium]|nr:TetR/AcrR family transcriptional regulator [Saprospiraceae bacterium]
MNLRFSIHLNDKLALRDPEATELGRKIVRQGLILMHQLGYEHFTFKKLAEAIETKEASIYRYFENKHRLLLYLLTWHWNLMEYAVLLAINNTEDTRLKIKKVVGLLCHSIPEGIEDVGLDKKALRDLATSESNKVYLIKEVDEINKVQLFKPYKDLCHRIAELFSAYAPQYPYPRSLASTVLEASRFQPYFLEHLPSLTDFTQNSAPDGLLHFLETLVFSTLDATIKSEF